MCASNPFVLTFITCRPCRLFPCYVGRHLIRELADINECDALRHLLMLTSLSKRGGGGDATPSYEYNWNAKTLHVTRSNARYYVGRYFDEHAAKRAVAIFDDNVRSFEEKDKESVLKFTSSMCDSLNILSKCAHNIFSTSHMTSKNSIAILLSYSIASRRFVQTTAAYGTCGPH